MNSTFTPLPLLLAWAVLSWAPALCAEPVNFASEDIEFFEKQIRPLLSEHCLECHSSQNGKTKGGLSLDSREALLRGGDSGPALIPGDPKKSLLARASRHENPDLKMPPKKARLPESSLELISEWIRRGAPDPRSSAGPPTHAGTAGPGAARNHWAFQPVIRPPTPAPLTGSTHPIDCFLDAARQTKGVTPGSEADPRTLLRRLSYDLTGLPPSIDEVENFAANPSKESFRNFALQYLDSERFGEKWGRHWLDIARYADTRGVPVPISADPRFLYSYAYRDYVIGSFNADKPLDEFILEQLAADILHPGSPEKHTALGFLTLGRTFLNNPHDIIDDRIDVVTRGLMGLTVTCARCHDHKFDPVPTSDYYSLYGIFNSCEVPKEPVITRERTGNPDYADYLAKRAEKLEVLESGLRDEARTLNRTLREKVSKYLLAVNECDSAAPAIRDSFLAERGLVAIPFEKWRAVLKQAAPEDPILGAWIVATKTAQEQNNRFEEAFQEGLRNHPGRPRWNPAITSALEQNKPKDIAAVASEYGRILLAADDAGRSAEAAARKQKESPPASLADGATDSIRRWMETQAGPLNLTLEEVEKAFSRKFLERKQKLVEVVEVFEGTHPGAPDRAIVLRERPNPSDSAVFIRGNPGNRGATVPRRFLEVLSVPERPVYRQGSGRLELARDIASKNNPLTARVYVNRVWGILFGKPLVGTPGDFGVRTAPPAVPQLLNALAWDFMEQGWSTKKLILSIVTSAAYRQSSHPNPYAEQADPENALVHHMNRKRLPFESLRDTLIRASGEMDLSMGGRPVVITKAPFPLRRTVYGFVDRQDLPSVFRSFDFANPDTSTAERFQTTVPQQALYLLNNDFVMERARALARSIPESDNTTRIRALFQRVLQRNPSPQEASRILAHLEQAPHKPSYQSGTAFSRWEGVCQAVLLLNETVFLD